MYAHIADRSLFAVAHRGRGARLDDPNSPAHASLSMLSDASLTAAAAGGESDRDGERRADTQSPSVVLQPLVPLPASATYETLDPNCNLVPVRSHFTFTVVYN